MTVDVTVDVTADVTVKVTVDVTIVADELGVAEVVVFEQAPAILNRLVSA